MSNEYIRILHISNSFDFGGGVAEQIVNWYRNIDKSVIRFDVTTFVDGDNSNDNEITKQDGIVYRLKPIREIGIINSFKQYNNIFKKNKYDIIHSHISAASFIAFIAAMHNGIKVRILHSHTTMLNFNSKKNIKKYFEPLSKFISSSLATHKLACSIDAADYLFGTRAYDKGQVTLIKNGIDIKKFTYNPLVRENIRLRLNIQNKFVLGHVGGFNIDKNHDFLIEIFKEVREKKPNSVLILIGVGELEKRVVDKVKSLGLEDDVIFSRLRKNVNEIMQAFDIFILPSLSEGLGIVLIEAQIVGLKCIVSDTVPKEVKITNLISFVSLKKSANYWSNKILDSSILEDRYSRENELIRAGYEIKESTRNLEDIYRSSVRIKLVNQK